MSARHWVDLKPVPNMPCHSSPVYLPPAIGSFRPRRGYVRSAGLADREIFLFAAKSNAVMANPAARQRQRLRRQRRRRVDDLTPVFFGGLRGRATSLRRGRVYLV